MRVLAIVLALVLLACPALAHDASCPEYDTVSQRLSAELGADKRHSALSVDQRYVWEVWINEENGRVVFLTVFPDKTACIVGAGGFWQEF